MSLVNRLFTLMSKPLSLIVSLMIIIVCFNYIDKPLAESLHAMDLKHNYRWLSWVTMAGLSGIYLVGFLLAALFFRYIRQNSTQQARMWFLWFCVLISNSICGFLKVILGRARPELWFEQHAYGFYGFHTKSTYWSFPSGHTSTIMAVAFGLCVVFPRYSYVFVITGCLIALSRILLVQHYLSDVLTAGGLVILEIGLLLWVLGRKQWLKPFVH